MSEASTSPLQSMVDRLSRYSTITLEDRAALLALPYSSRTFEAGGYLIREGDTSDHFTILVSGLVGKHKVSGEGNRQFVSLLTAGEAINFEQLYVETADHNAQTLTNCTVITVPSEALKAITADRPSIANAVGATLMVDLSIAREWLLNMGRRDARARVAHLLCEIAVRLDPASSPPQQSYHLPLTQEQLGDVLGLTAVHINRMLKYLDAQGLVNHRKHTVVISNWVGLVQAGDFNSLYLHIDPNY